MHVFETADDLLGAAGTHLGHSEWIIVDQASIDAFAAATGDRQWIHVDAARAAEGPYGTTIAHGYLTLSLIPALAASIFQVKNLTMGINYGLNRVRFPSAVLSGARVRAEATLAEATRTDHGVMATFRFVVACEGSERPACVADVLTLFA